MTYFAYGSNLLEEEMAKLCPANTFQFRGRACLKGHRLAFTRRSKRTHGGVADVVPAEGESVWGVLYEIEQPCLASLDRKEGYPWAYQRQPVIVQVDAGGGAATVPAFTYVVAEREPNTVTPLPAYVELIIRGAEQRQLPKSYLARLISLREEGKSVGVQHR
jgi:cation transport regulator ChaC